MKHRVLLGFAFLLGASVIGAQAQTVSPDGANASARKVASMGVINGKAISLPQPAYPATAKAVNAGGAVNVQVAIDETGNVISAEAISGHPLLRTVSVNAAKRAKFQPITAYSFPVKVLGIIVYNFQEGDQPGNLSWKRAGYEMSLAEGGDSLSPGFPADGISGFLPADWKDERRSLAMLKARQGSINAGDGEQGKITFASGAADVAPTTVDIATIDHKSVINELRTSIENRLVADQAGSWDFRFGVLLGKMSRHLADENMLRGFAAEARGFEMNAPAVMLKQINELAEILSKNALTASDKERVAVLLNALKM